MIDCTILGGTSIHTGVELARTKEQMTIKYQIIHTLTSKDLWNKESVMSA